MLVETDFCIPSGRGNSMYSKKGASTISLHLCFKKDQRDKYLKMIRN